MLSNLKTDSHRLAELKEQLDLISWRLNDINKFCYFMRKDNSYYSSYHFSVQCHNSISDEYLYYRNCVCDWQTVINGIHAVEKDLKKN